MWNLLGRFLCGRCGERREVGERTLQSPWRQHVAICRTCEEVWRRTGHRCAQCWEAIRDPLEIGLLVDRKVFAHVDCGGARVMAGPPSMLGLTLGSHVTTQEDAAIESPATR